jgi:DNA mismatch repair protein MutL
VSPAGRIRVLSEETVNRVAAGEVVERPAAALKELLENAVDAGAANVSVELERAGRGAIRVIDDGAGMGHDDLLLALERHATSKITAVEDLSHVASYGFRGEALPSIASVSRLRLRTRERGAAGGWQLVADGGRILAVEPCGCPEGTDVEVRELFHTVPARLKFLRTEATELGHCLQVTSRLALARPRVGFALRHGGRELLRLAPAADVAARLRAWLDPGFFAGLVPLRGAAGEIAVDGFVSRPGAGRPGAEHQQLFVNARPVRDPQLAQGVREACRDHFLQEAALSYYLWITLPPAAVDVNVHPTKREVRFRDLAAVRAVVAEALRAALRADRAAALPRPAAPWAAAPAEAAPAAGPAATLPPAPTAAALSAEPGAAAAYRPESPRQPTLAFAGTPGAPTPASRGPALLFGTYLVCPGPGGLALVDQHAAHERILYERVLARAAGAASQQLLEPLLLECTAAEEPALAALRPALDDLGVVIEPFGPRSWRVRALPPELPAAEAANFVRELASLGLDDAGAPRVEEFRHRAAALLACHAAVRANQRLDPAEVDALLADLARCDNPGACPHGRPTTVTIDRAEIERRFKRT